MLKLLGTTELNRLFHDKMTCKLCFLYLLPVLSYLEITLSNICYFLGWRMFASAEMLFINVANQIHAPKLNTSIADSSLIFLAYLFHGFLNLNRNWIWWPKPFRNKYWGFVYFLWWKALNIVRFKVVLIILIFLLWGCPKGHQVNLWTSKFLARGWFWTFSSANIWFNLSQTSPLFIMIRLAFRSRRCCFGFASVFPFFPWSLWLFSKYQINTLIKIISYED